MALDLRSWLIGYILGLSGYPMPFSTGVPGGEWESLWEGEMAFEPKYINKNVCHILCDHDPPAKLFYPGEYIRLTVSGVSKIYTAKASRYGDAFFGNLSLGLNAFAGEDTDTGDDFVIEMDVYGLIKGTWKYLCWSRYPGTYRVKLERKVPTAYLYNNVRLPDIHKVYTPELAWKFPYAVLVHHTFGEGGYSLNLYASQNIFEEYGEKWFGYKEATPDVARFALDGSEWAFHESPSSWYFSIDPNNINTAQRWPVVWTNFNLKYSDGTMYVANSSPVPVYE